MQDEQVTKLLSIVENGAKYVENISGTVWDMMVFGTRVEGIVTVVLVMIWSILLVKYAKIVGLKLIDAISNGDEAPTAGYMLLTLGGCVLTVVALVNIYGGLIATFAPQYYILKQILF